MSPQDEKAFEQWWEEAGQFCRSGGGEYEKTFAYRAWEASQKTPKQTLDTRLLDLEAELERQGMYPVPGTTLTRVMRESGLSWSLGLGGMQMPKRFFEGPSIASVMTQAERAVKETKLEINRERRKMGLVNAFQSAVIGIDPGSVAKAMRSFLAEQTGMSETEVTSVPGMPKGPYSKAKMATAWAEANMSRRGSPLKNLTLDRLHEDALRFARAHVREQLSQVSTSSTSPTP